MRRQQHTLRRLRFVEREGQEGDVKPETSSQGATTHSDNNGGDFYPGYQGYGEFFMGQHPDGPPPGLTFLPPSQGTPPLNMEPPMHPAGSYTTNPCYPAGCY
ncbi:LIM/homeobox protein Lhx5 [Elysia marginata]|uniref:LIM/homeobox protein Lhx5 n=1 Tax=Elysia marginata TaxID=1093978 RepID=A0AAV4EX24_9GAST|nr:LIM/homeobox protein Lhx5 [Elysia marginata]